MLLPITTDVIVEEARRLGEDDYRYTSRQLYYATCGAVERPPASATRGFIGLGGVLIALAGAVLWVHSFPLPAILAGLGVATLLAAPVNAHVEIRRKERRAQQSRALAASYPGFVAGPLREALQARPEEFTALVAAPASPSPASAPASPRPASTPPDLPAPGAGPEPPFLVVCDRAETADLLSANALWLPEGVVVTDLAGLLGGDADLPPAVVRVRRVVALHDADPAGCGMPAALRGAGVVDIIDAGLRPPASDAGLQVIEGAPARLPPGIETDLTVAEIGWLRSGRRLELATLTPREVVERLLAAAAASAGGAPAGA